MKYCFQIFLIIAFLSIFSACKKNEVACNQVLQVIPNDAKLVLGVDIFSLGQKGKVAEFRESPVVKDLVEQLDSKLAMEVLEDPNKVGIDFQCDVFIFSQSPPFLEDWRSHYTFFTGKVANPIQFKRFLDELVEEMEVDGFEIVEAEAKKQKNPLMFYVLGEQILAWDGVRFIMVGDVHRSQRNDMFTHLTKLFNLPVKDQLIDKEDFADFYNNMPDLGVWFNLLDYMELILGSKSELQALCDQVGMNGEETNIAYYQSFGKDHMQTKVKVYMDDEYEQRMKSVMQETPFNASLLKYLPRESLLIYSIAINTSEAVDNYILPNMGGVEEIEEAVKNVLGKTLKEIVGEFGGSVVLSLHGMTSFGDGDEIFPYASLVFDMNSMETLETLTDMIPEGIVERKEAYIRYSLEEVFDVQDKGEVYAYLAMRDDVCLLTTDKAVLESFVSGNGLRENFSMNPLSEDVLTNQLFMRMSLDLDDYPDVAIKREIEEGLGEAKNARWKRYVDLLKNVELKYVKYDEGDFFLNFEEVEHNIVYYILKEIEGALGEREKEQEEFEEGVMNETEIVEYEIVEYEIVE